MKLIRASEAELLFRLGKREKNLLLQLLALYPRIPPGHHKLSRSPGANPESERLLTEALAEHRAQSKERLEQLMQDPAKFKHDEKGLLLSLTPGELEWVLQVLNEVRVGCWVSIGSPATISPTAILDTENAPDIWAMESCGYFQAGLLEALKGPGGS